MLLAARCTSVGCTECEVDVKLSQSPESSPSCPQYDLFESPYTLTTVPDSHTDHPICIPPCALIFNSSTKENDWHATLSMDLIFPFLQRFFMILSMAIYLLP